MIRALRAFAGAVSYFTILPIGRFVSLGPPDAPALSYLPAIGAIAGGFAGAVWWIAARFANVGIAGWCAIATLVAITGAIHFDGFLDCCDALFAAVAPQRRLEILKDPRHGTYAFAGGALLAGLWSVTLAQRGSFTLVWALPVACAAARSGAVVNAWIFPYARAGAVTAAFAEKPNGFVVGLSFAILLSAAYLAFGPGGAAAVAVSPALGAMLGRWCAGKLGGGLVGDAYGFIVTLLEPLLVLAFVSIAAGSAASR